MIDIENEVYTMIADTLTDVDMSSIAIRTPASFPHCHFEAISNSTYEGSLDSSLVEKHADITFEANIYTTGDNRKSKAKEILHTMDNKMRGVGMVRTYCEPTPNIDESVYRLTVRWKCTASSDLIFRR